MILSLFITSPLKSQDLTKKQQHTVDKLFRKTGEIYFTFNINSRNDISDITKIISIDNVKGLKVWAYANREGFKNFLLLGIPYTILPHPHTFANPKTKQSSIQQLRSWTSYPTYTSYESIMDQFVIDHPNLCRLVNIGTLASGRKLLLIKISDNPDDKENEPQFLYTSTMHGDETAGYIGMLNYIDYLLTNYGTDPRVTNLVNNMEIWVNPLANPDGTYAGGNSTVSGATRFNANNIDLNRNYPDPQAGLHPDGNPWQTETQAFMGFADTMNFVMAANFHGGAEVVNYPWDTWSTATADENWWLGESKRYADTVFANSTPGYFTGVASTGYINGFDWYQITGGRQDYMNYFKHCREVTLEISNTKLLPTSSISSNWDFNYRSWLNYMEESLNGVRGIIKDACTNKPVVAKVFIAGHDFDSSHVYSTAAVGNYHRPIYQGTYALTFSAPGYTSQTITGINVTNGNATVVNVSLDPSLPAANFSASIQSSCGGDVHFTDLSGSASSWYWDFGDGTNSTIQNPYHNYAASGSYTVKLKVSNCAGTDSLILVSYMNVTVAEPPVVTNDSSLVCGPASLNLAATGSGTVNWYNAPAGGTLVHTGTSYVTPLLSNTTTYYVSNDIGGITQYVAPVNNSIGAGGFYTAGSYHYEKFTAISSFKLISILVNANSTASRTIELRNSAGIVLQSVTMSIPAGSGRINLNFDVPAGTDLQLGIAGGNNLYRNSTGGSYPYSITGIVTITGNSANNLAYYYYFYDWEIQQSCTSLRVPVTAIINPAVSLNSMITTPASTVCEGNMISFGASVVNGGVSSDYQWQVNTINTGSNSNSFSYVPSDADIVNCIVLSSNVCATNNPSVSNSISMQVIALPSTPVITLNGDTLFSSAVSGNQWYESSTGMIAGANNNFYIPSAEGNYFVLSDVNGCSSDTSNVVSFLSTGISKLISLEYILYPNPAGEFVIIKRIENSKAGISVLDILGKTVYQIETNESQIQIPCDNLSNGVYLIQLKIGTETTSHRLIIKR